MRSTSNPVEFSNLRKRICRKGRLLVVADGWAAQAGSEASRWAIRVAVERYYDAPAPASAPT